MARFVQRRALVLAGFELIRVYLGLEVNMTRLTLNACTFNRDPSPERMHDQGPERICSQGLEHSCAQHFCGQGTATRIMCDQGSAAKVMCVQALNLGRIERNLQSLDRSVINQQLVLLGWARGVWTWWNPGARYCAVSVSARRDTVRNTFVYSLFNSHWVNTLEGEGRPGRNVCVQRSSF